MFRARGLGGKNVYGTWESEKGCLSVSRGLSTARRATSTKQTLILGNIIFRKCLSVWPRGLGCFKNFWRWRNCISIWLYFRLPCTHVQEAPEVSMEFSAEPVEPSAGTPGLMAKHGPSVSTPCQSGTQAGII